MSAQHEWKIRCFQLTRWNIFGIYLKKVNFLFILYFLEDLQLINLLTMLQAESQ